MASLDDCIYAMYAVMIIARNNVHLFQQQSDKLYLCCTFGLLAWTLLSNISQLGLLLTHKPSKLLSNYQCFLDVVLFQSTTKGHFFLLSALLPSSSPPLAPQAVGQGKQRILSHISCLPSVSTASPKCYQGCPKKLHFTTQLEKTALKAQQSTEETSPPPTAPQQLPRGLADHLGMSLYKSGLNCRHSHIALSHDSFPIIPGLLFFMDRQQWKY